MPRPCPWTPFLTWRGNVRSACYTIRSKAERRANGYGVHLSRRAAWKREMLRPPGHGIIADDSELDGKARIEDMHVFGAHDIQDAFGLLLGQSKHDLQRLIGKFQRVCRVMRARVTNAVGAGDDARAMDTQFANHV